MNGFGALRSRLRVTILSAGFLKLKKKITILPDFSRRCPAVDPEDHHLFVSLGCAAENLSQASEAYGLKSESLFDSTSGTLSFSLKPQAAQSSALYHAIPSRQTSRTQFDRRKLSVADLKTLERAGRGIGVNVILLTEQFKIEETLELVIAGNSVQKNDAAFMSELKSWIRFSESEAVQKRDDLFSITTGNLPLPRWLAETLMPLFFTEKSENEKFAKHIRSSAGIAVFVSERSNRLHWTEAVRCFERFALQATALGIRYAPINQLIEVSKIRNEFANRFELKAGQRPDMVVRFGYGPEMPRSLRRSAETTLV